jgi:hypothetical protein
VAERPRDAGMQLELMEGTGPILLMCSAGDKLEIYKVDRCFEVLSPDDNDPKQLDPIAPWVVRQVTKFGAGNPIVARTVLQANAVLKNGTFKPIVDKARIMSAARRCRSEILECKRISDQLNRELEEIVNSYDASKSKGNVIPSFPSHEDLRERAGAFLLNAKQSLQDGAGIINAFFGKTFDGAHFHKIRDWLKTEYPDSGLCNYVEQNEPLAKHIVEMRNGFDHPEGRSTEIRDFYWEAETRRIHLPDWNIKGEPPGSIAKETVAIVDFILDFIEAIIVMASLMQVDLFPHIIVKNDPINVEMPVRYSLEIDPSFIKDSGA